MSKYSSTISQPEVLPILVLPNTNHLLRLRFLTLSSIGLKSIQKEVKNIYFLM